MLSLAQHSYYCGMTRSGKTTAAVAQAAQLVKANRGLSVLFWDTKGDTKTPWPTADSTNTMAQITQAGRVRFLPPADAVRSRKLLTHVVDHLIEQARSGTRKRWLIIVDEVQTLAGTGQASGPAQRLAMQGLGLGLTGFFISQSAADTSKTILKQCDRKCIFRWDELWEEQYWQTKMPPEVLARLKEYTRTPYHYAEMYLGELTGPHIVRL